VAGVVQDPADELARVQVDLMFKHREHASVLNAGDPVDEAVAIPDGHDT